MRLVISFGLFFITTQLLFSCKKNSTEPSTKGAISGTVTLWTDKSSSLNDASGVIVTIGNLPGKTFTTGANGQFRFEDIPFDQYDLVFTKQGYGTFKIFGITHTRPTGSSVSLPVVTNIPSIQMGAQSTTNVLSHTFLLNLYNAGPGVSYTYTVSPNPSVSNRGYVRAFLSTSSSVSSSNYTAYSTVRSVLSTPATGGFSLEELNGFGFTSGQTVYIKLYGESFISNDYTEPLTGKRIFPNLSSTSASAISFVIP